VIHTLPGWLDWLERRNEAPIVLGLERVRVVADRLNLRPNCPVLTVAGTNGKGSTCAFLEASLRAGGYRVGLYTSPHLLRYNERVRIDGCNAEDAALVEAFNRVESARAEIPLTYFEHGTLAALWLFAQARLDAWVLEVGLGGRLDAVNVIDADCALITPVDLDHQDWLGHDREAIAFEKAGIMRVGRPAVISDPAPPQSLLNAAASLGCATWRLGTEFAVQNSESGWALRVADEVIAALPRPALVGRHQYDNAAAALTALRCMRDRLPLPVAALRAGVASAQLAGRFQVLGQAPLRIVDVGHNPHAASSLAAMLADLVPTARCVAVCAMLADKDVESVVDALADSFAHWHIAPLPGPRGGGTVRLQAALTARRLSHSHHDDVVTAWRAACAGADTIAAFGSFLTAQAVLENVEVASGGN